MMDNGPVEGTDLLPSRGNGVSKGDAAESRGPPDGGVRAYSVLVGSFLTNGLLFGVINSYSVVYAPLVERLKKEQAPNAEILAYNEVDIEALQLLDQAQIKTLIPAIGPQAKFKKALDDWNIQKNQYLTTLLNASPDGKVLLAHIEGKEPLGEQLRKIFIRIVSTYIVKETPEAPVTATIYQHWLQEITLVGVLTIGTTFMLSPLSGVLTGFLGLRLTAVLGGTIATAGLLLSSFVVDYVQVLCITYGVLYGLGASLAYTPSLAILGHYFKKRLGIVNGIVTIGSSVFTVFMPTFMEYLIKNYGLEWMFRTLSVFTIGIALCGLLFKPIPLMVIDKPLKKGSSFKSLLKIVGNVQLWKNKKYRLWALLMPVALFGYFIPYIHIKEFIQLNFREANRTDNVTGNLTLQDAKNTNTFNDNLPLQCLAITSALGRLSFGYLADKPGIDRILMQQISFYIIGTLTIILPFVGAFWMVVVIALGMGLFEGGFISLIGPIAFELCGGAYAAQAIGCMLGLASIPMTIGPPVAGALLNRYHSYTVPFVLAGISPLVGATLMFTIRFYGNKRPSDTDHNGHISLARADSEKGPVMVNGLHEHGDGDIQTGS